MVDHFLSSQSEPALKRFRDGKWHAITTALADKYDFSLALGPEAAYKLRRKRPLADYATARIKQLLPANDEQVDFLASMKVGAACQSSTCFAGVACRVVESAPGLYRTDRAVYEID